MADFLEEQLLTTVLYGAGYQDDYNVKIIATSANSEFRSLIHPFPVRKFDVSYLLDTAAMWTNLMGIYHRAHGKYAGFRAKCGDEYSSNGQVSAPTAFDQPLLLVSAGVYQLIKRYGTDKSAGAAGYPYRVIKKPVAATTLIGIGTTVIRAADWSIDITTGLVTFAADQTINITGISKATQAVISCASHPYVIGQSIQISGCVGMVQINGLRALITATTGISITVSIDSTLFSTWTSGGVTHTRPQAGESPTAGFQFDFPVRFDTSLPVGMDFPGYRVVDGVNLIELLNP